MSDVESRRNIREFMESLGQRGSITPAARTVLDEDQATSLARAEIARKVIIQDDIKRWGKVAEATHGVLDHYLDEQMAQMKDMSHRDRVRFLYVLSRINEMTMKEVKEFIRQELSPSGGSTAQNIINILAFGDGDTSALTQDEENLRVQARSEVRNFVNQLLLESKKLTSKKDER